MSRARPEKPAYAWAQLYELESRKKRPDTRQARRGRPPHPVKRRNVSVKLTDEEERLLSVNQATLKLQLQSVSKGQVVGLAMRMLNEKLGQVPIADATTWEEVMRLVMERDG